MKALSSQFFVIALLAVLAGLTFWLNTSINGEEPRPDSKLRHDPDAKTKNFSIRRFDNTGEVKYLLSAPFMKHFPDDDTSEITSPNLVSFRPEAPPVTITSKFGKITSKAETVFLWDDVSITREATVDRPEMIARMPDLTSQPDAGYAFTNSPVEITQGESWVKGVGAYLDNNTSTLILQSQVTGLYIRPRPTTP